MAQDDKRAEEKKLEPAAKPAGKSSAKTAAKVQAPAAKGKPEPPKWAKDTFRYLSDLWSWLVESYDHLLPLLSPSETKFLAILAVVIGLFTGVFAYVFDVLIRAIFQFGLGGSPSMLEHLPYLERWRILVVPAVGGLVAGPVIKYLCPEAKGHGVPEVMLALHKKGGRIRGRVAALKAFASAVTIGSGGSAGREGPIVQIGAAIGSRLAQLFRFPSVTLKTMVASGSAAGIAAAFNAPLGGMAFAIEIILGEISAGPFAMVVLSTVVAATVSRGLHGSSAYFTVPTYRMAHTAELPLYLVLGVICGVLSKTFVRMLYRFEDEFDLRLNIDAAWKPALGGLLVGAVGMFVPGALGTGYMVIETALKSGFGVAAVLVLLSAKFLSTSLTLGSGGSGGIFMPCLFCGAMVGSLLGQAFNLAFPGVVDPGAYAMVGMAAFIAGAAHAPLTAILILFEMTYDYAIILPLMVAVVTSVMVARVMESESIYTLKLVRRGVKLKEQAETSLMALTPVSDVMSKKVLTLESDFPIGKLGRHFNKTKRTGFPVLDKQGRLVGMVTYHEAQAAYAAEPPPPPDLPVQKIMRTMQPLYPDDPVSEAVRRMHQSSMDRLPVVSRDDPKKLLGIVSHTDLLTLYAKRVA